MHIVLHEPEIPANTGNIGRTCLVTGSRLHLIEPMGFILNDKNLKRAGMDYWKDVDCTIYDSLADFYEMNSEFVDLGNLYEPNSNSVSFDNYKDNPSGLKSSIDISEHTKSSSTSSRVKKSNLWMATTKAQKTYADVQFNDGDYIMFGKESAGIPEEMLMSKPESCIRIPMAQGQRSLNLSNSAAIILYEALRQNSFGNLEQMGQLHHHTW